jgi:hypothetical protein
MSKEKRKNIMMESEYREIMLDADIHLIKLNLQKINQKIFEWNEYHSTEAEHSMIHIERDRLEDAMRELQRKLCKLKAGAL